VDNIRMNNYHDGFLCTKQIKNVILSILFEIDSINSQDLKLIHFMM